MKQLATILAATTLLSLSARAADLDERLFNTFYVPGDNVTYVLVIREDRTFELTAPGGNKISSTYRATGREIGFAGSKSTRRFNYAFDGENLILEPTLRDEPGNDLLKTMPPVQDGQPVTYLSKANWEKRIKPVPPQVIPPKPPEVVVKSGIDSLRQLGRERGGAVAQAEADYRVFMAGGDRNLLYELYDDARANYERALKLKPDSREARDGAAEAQGRSLMAQADNLHGQKARELYRQAEATWPPLRAEIDDRLRKKHGGDPLPNPVFETAKLEAQIQQLVKAEKIADASRLAKDAQRANPDSLKVAKINESLDRLQTIDSLSVNTNAILEKVRAAAVSAQEIDRKDAVSKRLLDFAEKTQASIKQQPGVARGKLLSADYDGVTHTYADTRAQARQTVSEIDTAATAYEKKSKGEEGFKLGDIVILTDKDAEKWKGTARRFQELAKEAKPLAD